MLNNRVNAISNQVNINSKNINYLHQKTDVMCNELNKINNCIGILNHKFDTGLSNLNNKFDKGFNILENAIQESHNQLHNDIVLTNKRMDMGFQLLDKDIKNKLIILFIMKLILQMKNWIYNLNILKIQLTKLMIL